MPGAEVVVPFRVPEQRLGRATEVRTTLLVSSLQSLRRRGHLDQYLRHLPAQRHATIQAVIAGQWAAIEVGRAHYVACEALEQTHRLYDRIFRGGGGTRVSRRGPKDARVEMAGFGIADVAYFATAMTGVFEAGAELFCKKAYAQVVPRASTAHSVVLDIAWA